MRTTIDFSDDMFRELKSFAALQGMSIKEFLRIAVEHELARVKNPRISEKRIKFPLLESKEPGTLHLTNAEIDDLLT